MAAFFLDYATPPMVPVEQKVFNVTRLSGLNGRIPENAAIIDHVANVMLKPPCVTCPRGFRLLPNQTSSANCYFNSLDSKPWEEAQLSCASTPGAYLYRPNTIQEANDVRDHITDEHSIWTGANDKDTDGNFTFITENSPFSFNDLPFGSDAFNPSPDAVYVRLFFDFTFNEWRWGTMNSLHRYRYICECQR
ncbi:Hypothetical predicted protein, partial [Mytilus galloprovincialis]